MPQIPASPTPGAVPAPHEKNRSRPGGVQTALHPSPGPSPTARRAQPTADPVPQAGGQCGAEHRSEVGPPPPPRTRGHGLPAPPAPRTDPDCNPAPDRGSDCNPGPRTAGAPTAHRRGPGGPGGAAPRRRRLPGAGSGPRRNPGGTHGRAGGAASAAAAGWSGRRRRMKSGQSPERSSRMARPLPLPLPPLRSPPAAPRPAETRRSR